MLYRRAPYTEHISTNPLEYGPLWPYYSDSYYNHPELIKGFNLGAFWELVGDEKVGGGNVFMKVKTTENLTVGQQVSFVAPTASTVAAGSTASIINWTAGGLTVNAEVGNYLFVANSTALGGGPVLKMIKANTATTITVSLPDVTLPGRPADVDAFTLAPTAGDVAIIIRPYRVRVCTATTTPCGIALGTVTTTNSTDTLIAGDTIIQVAGLALVWGVGNGTALAVGVPAVPAAAGVVIGGGGVAMAYTAGTSVIPQAAYAGAGQLVPCLVNYLGA